MKQAIKKILKRWNLLEKIQFHPWYRMNRSKELKQFMDGQREFYKKLFGKRNKLIIDVGANVGDYSWLFSKIADKVIAIEPDKTNLRILHIRFPRHKNVTIIPKALSASVGEAELYIESAGGGFNTLSDKWVNVLGDANRSRFDKELTFEGHSTVPTTTLDKIIGEFGNPDYIKIDVEGFEWEVIRGLHERVPLISFECNLPEFRFETLSILEYLEKLDQRYVFNYINDAAFILPEWIPASEMISLIRETNLRYIDMFCQLKN